MTETVNKAKAEAFAERLLGTLNDASLILLTSLGHRTRLFDTMADLPPSTSAEIADAAGLHERYVREWLGGMVVSGVIEYDPAAQTYRLPAEHGAALTRAAGPNNVGAYASFVPILASVEDEVADCFR
ncbi:MAG: transcriptional regulator, partial [Actinomycetota bacterium]|nr:transcriptional regulator [Actinomycetota bacterium]